MSAVCVQPLLRNEQFQEELWKRSFEFLKDHLSPETVEKYGPLPEPAETIGGETVGDCPPSEEGAIRPSEGEKGKEQQK